jgi:hypothetical protein
MKTKNVTLSLIATVLLPMLAFAAAPTFIGQFYSVGDGPQTVRVGDLNSDLSPDILTANLIDGTLSILFNNGDGTFQQPFTPVGIGPTRGAAIAEMTGDGIMDIVAITETTGGAVAVCPGAGNGTFFSAIETTVSQNGLFSLAVADINLDNREDAVVSFQDMNMVKILIGNGNGSFGPIHTLASSGGPNFVQIQDVNQDAIPDLVIGHLFLNSVGIAIGNGDGTFGAEAQLTIGVSGKATPLFLGDVNHDNNPDIAVGVDSGTVILLGNGDGSFGSPSTATNAGFPIGLLDMDLDTHLDLVVLDFVNSAVSIALGNGDGTFQNAVIYPGSYTGGTFPPMPGHVSDLNADGRPDIALANFSQNTVGVFISTPAPPTLPHPTNKNQCKNGGYVNYSDDSNQPFRNQGQCIAYVNHH